MSQQIKKKFLGGDQIGSDQILIEKDLSLRGTKQDDSVVDLIKLNSTDEVLLKGIKILNSSNLVPADILPSYVDDVLEYADLAAIQAVNPGETGKIYVALDTNKCYRWSGSTYIQITSGAVDSVNGSTGVVVLDSSDIGLSSPVNGETTVQGSLEDLEGRIDSLEVGGGDTKQVKISANDTTEGYVEDKIVGASGKISISTLNDGANEDLEISIGADVFDKTVDSTDQITEGAINVFYTEGRFDSSFSGKNTDNLGEGASNLYFTDTRARTAAVADSITDGVIDIAPSQNAVFDALAGVSGDISAHVNAITDAHDASAISISAIANIAAADVQGALEEIQGQLDNVAGDFVDTAGDTMTGDLSVPNLYATSSSAQIGYFGGEFSAVSAKNFQNSDVTDMGVNSTGSKVVISAGNDYARNGAPGTVAKDIVLNPTSGEIDATYSRVKNVAAATDYNDAVIKGQLDSSFSSLDNYISSVEDALTQEISDRQAADAAHLNAITDAHDASAISFDNTGTDLVAIDMQNALVELGTALSGEIDNLVTLSGVALNSTDLGSFTGAILPAGLDIKEALQELSDAQEDHLNDTIDAHDASAISFSPAGDIVATDVQSAIQELDTEKLALAGGTMAGNINMNNAYTLTNVPDPSAAQDAANKRYVDAVAEGLHVHAPAKLLAASDLGGTYNNGSSGVGAHIDFGSPIASIDGVTSFSVGDRIILTFQNGSSLDIENGIYFIEDAADIDGNGDITKLTRAVDFNTPIEMAGGDFVFVQNGSQYADTGWVMTETVVAVGTTPVKFVQFSGAGTYSAGDALSLTGTEFDVKFDNSSIGLNGSNELEVKSLGISNAMLQDDSVTNAKLADDSVDEFNIDADAIGNGLTGGSGTVISVDHDGEGLQFSGTQLSLELDGSTLAKGVSGLKLNDTTVSAASYGTTAAKTASFTVDAQGRLTAASEQNIDISSTQVNNFQSAVRAEVSAGDGLDYNSGSGEFSVDLKSAGGLKIDATELAVEPADFAGNGLEDDGSDNLRIKKEFSTVADISVSANGLSIVNRWGKESYVVIAADTVLVSDYYDLDHEIEASSLVAFVDRLAIHESIDYTISTVSGVTRVTFIGDLTNPGQSQLAIGDRLTFTYQKKAKV